MVGHTILLMQATHDPHTRTYSNYKTFDECINGICKIYEEHLKEVNPKVKKIYYEVGHLFQFIDKLPALSCLVYEEETKSYASYFKDYIKEKLYNFLEEATGTKDPQKEPNPLPKRPRLVEDDTPQTVIFEPVMQRADNKSEKQMSADQPKTGQQIPKEHTRPAAISVNSYKFKSVSLLVDESQDMPSTSNTQESVRASHKTINERIADQNAAWNSMKMERK